MAQLIHSSDFLVICFIFSGNDLDTDMAGVITNAEAYMQENNCWIGTSPYDFKTALFWLAYDTGLLDKNDYERFPKIMKKVKLRDLIIPILSKRQLYCNDEGEYWEGSYDFGNAFNNIKDNWFDDNTNPIDIECELEIRRFFATPENLIDQSTEAFFREHSSWEKLQKLYFRKSL